MNSRSRGAFFVMVDEMVFFSHDLMNDLPDPAASPSAAESERPHSGFWRKLGGGSLSISIIIHAILLAIGLVWVFQVMPQKEPEVDFMPKGGGGGQQGAKSEVAMKKRATMTPANAPRVAAKDVVSNFTLPEPDAASTMSSVGALGGSSMAGGLGGSGSGGGKGDGKGTGFGSGMGPGLGGGGGAMNPFGMTDPNANALVGTFFDTKQTQNRETKELSEAQFLNLINDFVKRGWNEKVFEKYYRAPKKLYQTRIYIPMMAADGAPKAFNCENEVKPSRWIIVYRGVVSPPKTGKFRFVGGADDMITVRFNGKPVLDAGYYSAYLGEPVWGETAKVLGGKVENKDVERKLKRFFNLPVNFYYYPSGNYGNMMGGCMVGEEFEAKQGVDYPIEILISEIPGQAFGASLLIEEIGATYSKAPSGCPILPLFRLDGSLPEAGPAGAPPFDAKGSVWKLINKSARPEI